MNDQATMILPDGWTPLRGLASVVAQMLLDEEAVRPAGTKSAPATPPPKPADPEVAAAMIREATARLPGFALATLTTGNKVGLGLFVPEDGSRGFAFAVYPPRLHDAVRLAIGGRLVANAEEVVEVRAAG